MKGQAELYKAWKKARTTLAPPSKIQVFGAAYEQGMASRQFEIDLLSDKLDALRKENEALRTAGCTLADELEQWSLTEQHDETTAAFEGWTKALKLNDQQFQKAPL
jgi:hypothetical protein